MEWAAREQAISDTRRELFIVRSSIRMMHCPVRVLGGYRSQALEWLDRLTELSEGASASALSDILALRRQVAQQIAEIERLSAIH